MVFSHVGYQQALQRSPPTEPRATWSPMVPAGGPVQRTDRRRTMTAWHLRTQLASGTGAQRTRLRPGLRNAPTRGAPGRGTLTRGEPPVRICQEMRGGA